MKSLLWTDVYDIAIALEETHSEVNPLEVRFTDLYQWVLELPGFSDNPAHCGEKVLEAIQTAWIEEKTH